MSVKMIDITSKEPVYREAVARGFLKVDEDTMSDLINNGVNGITLITVKYFLNLGSTYNTACR